MVMSMIGYQDLECPTCSGKNFIQVQNLIWKEGLGMSPRPGGWYCLDCQKRLDTEESIRCIKRRHLIEKQKELENAV